MRIERGMAGKCQYLTSFELLFYRSTVALRSNTSNSGCKIIQGVPMRRSSRSASSGRLVSIAASCMTSLHRFPSPRGMAGIREAINFML
jgi:hypothetical protein